MALLQQGEGVDQLCICISPEVLRPFYLTIASLHGKKGTVRSLEEFREGFQFHMLPLESGERAEGMDADAIQAHKQTIEASIVRRDSPTHYTIRVLDPKASRLRERIRTSSKGDSTSKLEVTEAGPITTISVSGELGITSAAQLSDKIGIVSRKTGLIIVDISNVTSLASVGIGMIMDGFKSVRRNGAKGALLLDPQSPIIAILAMTRLTEIIPTFTARDEAVAMLLTGD